MGYNPKKHHRHSTRLQGYDYSQAGAYFITVVTHLCEHSLGEIVGGQPCLSQAGHIAEEHWRGLPDRFSYIDLDHYVVMPNHLHGIILITDDGTSIQQHNALGKIVRAFKAATSQSARKSGVLEFAWQRNYHDRIIRNERELDAIRQYIVYNPANWHRDKENEHGVGYRR